jgi:hypothetical protein
MARSKVLARELETFEQQRKHLLEHHLGKWALVYRSDVIGIFDSDLEAIYEGHERFGNVPLLVKQVVEVETPVYMLYHRIGG